MPRDSQLDELLQPLRELSIKDDKISSWQNIIPKDLDENQAKTIGRQWMLIAAVFISGVFTGVSFAYFNDGSEVDFSWHAVAENSTITLQMNNID